MCCNPGCVTGGGPLMSGEGGEHFACWRDMRVVSDPARPRRGLYRSFIVLNN